MIYASFYDRLLLDVDLSLSFQIALETCFASHSTSMMSKSFTALQVLLRLQDISVDCSDGEDSNSKLDDALNNDLEEVELDSSGEESDVSSSEDDDNDPPNHVKVKSGLDRKRRNSLASFGYLPCTTWALATVKHTKLQARSNFICDKQNYGKQPTVIFLRFV